MPKRPTTDTLATKIVLSFLKLVEGRCYVLVMEKKLSVQGNAYVNLP